MSCSLLMTCHVAYLLVSWKFFNVSPLSEGTNSSWSYSQHQRHKSNTQALRYLSANSIVIEACDVSLVDVFGTRWRVQGIVASETFLKWRNLTGWHFLLKEVIPIKLMNLDKNKLWSSEKIETKLMKWHIQESNFIR